MLLPAYRGDEPYIFVCYSHADKAIVFPELRRLHEGGVNVYYDEGISPGHEWTQELADAIDGCRQFLFFVSPHSVASRNCRNEVQYALSQDKSVMLVHLQMTELPSGLKLSLGGIQAILKYELSMEHYQRKIRSALGELMQERPLVEEQVADRQHSIAVLPFLNMSTDPEQEYFSDGITEDILSILAQSTDLIVRPRSSSFMFKASSADSRSIGQQLDVTHVVEGGVRKSGKHVRISVQLIDVATNRPVWSHRYDRTLTDIFRVQDEITNEILTALDALLSSRGTTTPFSSSDAYDAFLRARSAFNQYDFGDADDWLAKAVALDPNNADAWALRAKVNAYQSALDLSPNSGGHRDLRRRYEDKVLLIDPAHPVPLAQRALMDAHFTDRKYQAAIDQLVQLASDYPNDEDTLIYLTFVLATIGRGELVARVTEKLVRLAPLSRQAWITRIIYGCLLFGAVEAAKLEFERFPSAGPMIGAHIALAEADASAFSEYAAQLTWTAGSARIYGALVAYLNGDFRRACEVAGTLKQAQGYLSYRVKALASLVEGDADSAFAHYRDAILSGEQTAISMVQGLASWRRVFPEFFADARYNRMLEEFKLDRGSTAQVQVPELPF